MILLGHYVCFQKNKKWKKKEYIYIYVCMYIYIIKTIKIIKNNKKMKIINEWKKNQ